MPPPGVKICGLSNEPTLAAAISGEARFVGFNFAEKSPRFVKPDTASFLRRGISTDATAIVAVVVDAGDDLLSEIAKSVRPDYFQLHGTETPARIEAVRAQFDMGIIKACPIAAAEDLTAALSYEAIVDHILLDAKPPKGAQRTGGHGQTFDWSLLKNTHFKKPWILSGGLNINNLAAAVDETKAPNVDVASGVETAPGQKDEKLISAFLDLSRTL